MCCCCFFLFYPTESQSTNLQKGKRQSQKASNLSMEPPTRVREIPWTHTAHYPSLTRSIRKQPHSSHFSVVPEKKARKQESVKETIKKPMVHKDYFRQPLHTMKAFEPTQATVRESTREAPFQNTLSALEARERISPTEISHPKTQPEKLPAVESSEESSLIYSTTSSLFSLGISSKKD